MRSIATFLLAGAAACGVVTLAGANHLSADRQLDRDSEVVRRILDAPPPPSWDEIRVLASVMGIAHYPEAAAALMSLAEREALLELLGEPPPRPAKVEYAIQENTETREALWVLRERVLEKPVAAEVLQEHDPSLNPKIHGYSFRHDGGSVWTRDDGGTQRAIGARIVNRGEREVLGGWLEVELGTPRKPQRFSCRYSFPLAPGESKAMLCYGDATRPLDDLMRAIGGVAQAPPPVRHLEIVYRLRGIRFRVGGPDGAFAGGEEIDARAMALIRSKSCQARNACGAAVQEKLTGLPMLGGFVLGVITGAIGLLALWIGGRRAAGRAGSGIALVLFALSVAGIIAAAAIGLKGHVLYALLFAGLAAGYAGKMIMGFLLGLGGVVLAWGVLRDLRRRLRAA
jgi:hypothetical protein